MAESELLTPARSISHRQLAVELVNPVGLIRRLGLPGSGPYVFLDSAGGNPELCRYSILAWSPRLSVTIRQGIATLSGPDESPSEASSLAASTVLPAPDPFNFLRELQAAMAPDDLLLPDGASGLPLTGGLFGLVSYDAGRYIESLPHQAVDDLAIPDFDVIFPRRLICYDHQGGMANLLFEDAAPGELEEVETALRRQALAGAAPRPESIGQDGFSLSSATRSNLTSEDFQNMVRRAKEYILDGDIFQSNLSQRLELDYDGDSLELYDALRAVNPSPFAGYLEFNGYQIISSSPERLVQLQGRRAQTRPIAGTRRRGLDYGEDDSLTQELNLDPKERAEHIMLVDLERNDMGRVCDYGSVRVNELMVNEAYSHVIHIVSNVLGELHERKDAYDLLKAMFPGGTITGCPKVRCMEIIDELEPVRRGPYTGSFGYIGYNGDMDMNIIIRTLVRCGDRVYMQAGAGIVADSDPEREYQESLRKAEAMVRAVELAKHGSAASPAKPSAFLAAEA
ncbi:MAG: anthranilate synthase component I family protein [Actinobacteria bacterium]|nr:anthranilate synthase component I family protein [Actinomycetota bacterium]